MKERCGLNCAVWMDACELPQALEKQSVSDATKPQLIQAVNNYGTLRSRIREVSSRYKSPARSTGPKPGPSPHTRTSPSSTVSGPKRAVSAEKKRSLGPLSPPSPPTSTPVQDTSSEMLLASKKIVGNKLPESLRPSAMRSLSVSFKSDIISVPISKREKPVSNVLSDRALRPSSNIAHKHAELPSSRKPTPERKTTPNIGKKSSDKSENFKPIDGLPACLVDQHRWPRRVKGRASSTALNRNINLTDTMGKTASLSHSNKSESYPRRLSLGATSKPLQNFTSDLLCCDSGKIMLNGCSSDDSSMMAMPTSSSSPDKTLLMYAAARAQSLPTPGLHTPSPPVSRGISPARNKVGKPSSRGPSPARVRPSSPSRQPQSSTSVLSFIADIKKGNKAANHIEDVHQLRLLYNRHLQWQYANARSDAVLLSLKVKAEKTMYSMWRSIGYLLDSATAKRIHLQHLRLILKLYSVLDNQLTCLDRWALVERDHATSLTLVTQELQAGTICIPVTGGARGDIETIKAAVCSAVDVMQAMGSSLCSILSQMEGMSSLVSQVADKAAEERAMLDECESLMSITAAFQVQEYSLRTQIFQSRQALGNGKTATLFGF